MYRFFEIVIRPVLDVVRPSCIVEVGSDNGYGTELIAAWCQQAGATLHSIDPLPKYDVQQWRERWGETVVFHEALSLNALQDVPQIDVVLIDGDHNWYTVFHELEALGTHAAAAARPFPLTFLHDVGWPYGRRDLYYDPTTVADAYRHPHRKGGLLPGSRELLERGFNDHLENALHEGTPRNGVLTAAEDFVAGHERLRLRTVPGLHGLGIIQDVDTEASLSETWEEVLGADGMQRVVEAVEDDRLQRLVEVSKLKRDVAGLRTRVAEHRAAADAAAETARTVQEERDASATALARTRKDVEALRAQLAQEQERASADRRAIEKRDRELRRLQQDLLRLRGRKSVRIALKAARVARPAVQLSRNDLAQRVKVRGRRAVGRRLRAAGLRGASTAGAGRGGPTLPRRRPSGPGPFYELLRRLVDAGVPDDFSDAWALSEGQVPPASSAGGALPLVSIVMPTHNRAALIGDAVRSVLSQTYENWELIVCDDASDDDTHSVLRGLADPRISVLRLEKRGAAAARNAGLAKAAGDLVAYLDSDNLWHPQFLEVMVGHLVASPGRLMAYCKYVDVTVDRDRIRLKKYGELPFDFDALAERNFIDLNGLVHRRTLHEQFGGFDETLVRQQDWDLILKYAYLRDPLYVDRFLMLYRRCDEWNQITRVHRADTSSPATIRSSLAGYYRDGLPLPADPALPSLSIVSWDICRNHFSKAYNLAEAMADRTEVQLVGFRFFDEPVFRPYADAEPRFATTFLPGGDFPEWRTDLARAVAAVRGDVVYAVKPRLPSLGVALLANYHRGIPVVLESNDLESVVTRPRAGRAASVVRLEDVDPADPALRNPYGQLWTEIMEGLAPQVPLRTTHNAALDEHFGGGAFWIRNPKDDRHFDPDLYDREAVRARFGFEPDERVLLFGGMVRKHKGVFELLELLERPHPRYRLVVVGSRETPDQVELKRRAGDRVTFVEPLDRNDMAAVNLASDAVVLWLDPAVPASRYQMPFKLTDALAMRVPVLANDVGDLADLGAAGYVRTVPFGRVDQLADELDALYADDEGRTAMVDAGRRLFLRQFSYAATRAHLSLVLRSAGSAGGTLPVAEDFAAFFAAFMAHSGSTTAAGAGAAAR